MLEVLERWRSATDRLPSLGRPDDEQLASLTEQLRSVRGLMRRENDPEQLRGLEVDASRLERLIRDRDWALSRRGTSRAVPVRVREARAHLLDVDRDLVWFFRHRGRICAVGVDRWASGAARPHAGGACHRARPTDQGRPACRGDPSPRAPVGRGVVVVAVECRRARRRAARPWRSSRGLVLVTCPEISALPWALLPSMRARPLTVAVSLTSFARRGLGGAASSTGPARQGRPPVHVSVGPAVPRASAEARAIARTWGGSSHDRRALRAGASSSERWPGPASSTWPPTARTRSSRRSSPRSCSTTGRSSPTSSSPPVCAPTTSCSRRARSASRPAGPATSRSVSPSHCSRSARGPPSQRSRRCPTTSPRRRWSATTSCSRPGLPSDEALARAVDEIDDVAAAFLNLGGQYRP